MIEVLYKPEDKRYLFLIEDGRKVPLKSRNGTKMVTELQLLENHLNKIPDYMFLPSFSGIPSPVVFLHKFKRPSTGETCYWCHSGLWHEIHTWAKKNNIYIKGVDKDEDFKYTKMKDSLEEFTQWCKGLDLNLELRDYQIQAAWKILKFRQSMSQLATRSGKTLIAYVVFRYMFEKLGAHNILMIVPNISLVKQGVEDMKQYKEFFKTETIWAKSEMCESSNLTIGTFQSLVRKADKKNKKYDPKFFDKFDIVLCDECHKAPCKSIDTILSMKFMRDVKLRFGFSGTIPEESTIENFACQSLIGPVIQDISSRELIDEGYLADVDITQIRIHYPVDQELKNSYRVNGEYLSSSYDLNAEKKRILLPKEERRFLRQHKKILPYSLKQLKKKIDNKDGLYTEALPDGVFDDPYLNFVVDLCKSNASNLLLLEQMVMFEQKKRYDILLDILTKSDKNYIVFAHHSEYLKDLYNKLTEDLPMKTVLLINGSIPQKKREKILQTMENNDSCILLASYSCVGTGLTFKNIDYGVFAESFKSQIINKQSLGRGLLLAPGKDKFHLYDIIDCFPTRRLEWQGNAKKKLFSKEGYDVKVEYK